MVLQHVILKKLFSFLMRYSVYLFQCFPSTKNRIIFSKSLVYAFKKSMYFSYSIFFIKTVMHCTLHKKVTCFPFTSDLLQTNIP